MSPARTAARSATRSWTARRAGCVAHRTRLPHRLAGNHRAARGTTLAPRRSMSEALRIWAPNARRVEVVRDGLRTLAEPEPDGWWRGPQLTAGDRYAISLDGGPPRPDPRSRWQ